MAIGKDEGVFIIAEAGVNHNGRLAAALELVGMARDCGADAVKFQTFKAAENVTAAAPLADYQTRAGAGASNQLEMLKALELDEEDFRAIKEKCDSLGLDFISTPDDEWSVDLLVKLGVPFIKVASAEVDNLPFLSLIGRQRRPVLLSTGMSTLEEVARAVAALKRAGASEVALLHCTSNYPANPTEMNLRAIVTLSDAFQVKVGLSDHTAGWEAAVAAVALGAEIIEKHITLDKTLPGPDHEASADPAEFALYVAKIRLAELMLGDGVKRPRESEKGMIPALRRSLVAARNLGRGEVLSWDMIRFKRPGTGISPAQADEAVGKTLQRDLLRDQVIQWRHLK